MTFDRHLLGKMPRKPTVSDSIRQYPTVSDSKPFKKPWKIMELPKNMVHHWFQEVS